jgi:hypothetical protein
MVKKAAILRRTAGWVQPVRQAVVLAGWAA